MIGPMSKVRPMSRAPRTRFSWSMNSAIRSSSVAMGQPYAVSHLAGAYPGPKGGQQGSRGLEERSGRPLVDGGGRHATAWKAADRAGRERVRGPGAVVAGAAPARGGRRGGGR